MVTNIHIPQQQQQQLQDTTSSSMDEPLLLQDDNDKDTTLPVSFFFLPFTVGSILGLSVQLITICAYAHQLSHPIPASTFIPFLVHADLILYATIWCLFLCGMTKRGCAFIQQHHHRAISKQSIFLFAMTTLIGIIVGSFLAWILVMHVHLGVSIPVESMGITVAVDVLLCYFLAKWSKEDRNNDDDTTSKETATTTTTTTTNGDDAENNDDTLSSSSSSPLHLAQMV